MMISNEHNDDAFLYEAEHGPIEEPINEFLKSCPICGHIPIPDQLHKSIWVVRCTKDAHVVESRGDTEEKAIAEWNSRVEPIGNPDELPEWFINHIDAEIVRLFLFECDLSNHGNSRIRANVKRNALKWVLSLRRDKND